MGHLHIFYLFYHRFGNGCFWIDMPNVVSIGVILKIIYKPKNQRTFDLWFCPISERLPFDWKSPYGYLIAIAIQYVMGRYGYMIGASIFVLSIGAYLYGNSLSKGIKGSLFAFNRNVRAKTDQSILLEQVIEFLELHSNAKQLIAIQWRWIDYFQFKLFFKTRFFL